MDIRTFNCQVEGFKDGQEIILNYAQVIADNTATKIVGRFFGDKQAQKPMEQINLRGRSKFDKLAGMIKTLKIDPQLALKNLRREWTKHGR